MTDLKVGDKLWYVEKWSTPRYVVIEKIGREYVWLSNMQRFRKGETWKTQGGRCYVDEAEHSADVSANDLWRFLHSRLPTWERPAHLDEAAIRKIAELVGVTLP